METTRRQFMATATSAAATASLGLAQASGTPPARKPNIVLLFADDLGYGDLACYGNPVIKTPVLDQLAREGTRCTCFYAHPACSPSRSALLTGRYPVRPGCVPSVLGPESETGLAASEITIATALKPLGYRTKAVGKWHLGHAREEFLPLAHGFDEFFGLPYSNDMIRPWVQTDRPLQFYRDNTPLDEPVDQTTLTKRYTEEAVKFIRECADTPFFLYVPYSMTHLPLAVSPEFQGKSKGGLFGDAVEELDWSAGQILSALRESGVEKDTLVIWTSDNGPWQNAGERMFQPGPDGLDNKPWHVGTPGPFRNSKGTTYEGGVRVPGIFRWPGQFPAGQTLQELARTLDILPTVLSAAGAAIPDDRPIDGNNILPLLRGEISETPTQIHYYFNANQLQAVRRGAWKYTLAGEEPELFHLERDFGERSNCAGEMPELASELRALMEAFAQETGTKLPEVAPTA